MVVYAEIQSLLIKARSASEDCDLLAAKKSYNDVIVSTKLAIEQEKDHHQRDGLLEVLEICEAEMREVTDVTRGIEELAALLISEPACRDTQVWSPPPCSKPSGLKPKNEKPRIPSRGTQPDKTRAARAKDPVEVAKDVSTLVSSSFSQSQDGKLSKFDPELVSMIEGTMTKGAEVKFTDIAGLNDVKLIIRNNIVWPMLQPGLFTGIRSPCRGFLFYGPPGTGKTKLAKAIATETSSTFFYISCSSIASKWRGESEKLIKIMFDMAAEHAPSTIFIDEIDTIGSERGGANEHEASRRVKSELLLNMDMLKTSEKQIWVIGATNIPWCIDAALRRRFEKRIYIPLPDISGRTEILKMSLSTVQIAADVDLHHIAQKLDGYSNADIINICKEAATIGISKLMNSMTLEEVKELRTESVDIPVTAQHFQTALDTISSSINQKDLENFENFAENYGSM